MMFSVMAATEPAHVERRGIVVMVRDGVAATADFAGLRNQLALHPGCVNEIGCAAPLGAESLRVATAIGAFFGAVAGAIAIAGPNAAPVEFFPALSASL